MTKAMSRFAGSAAFIAFAAALGLCPLFFAARAPESVALLPGPGRICWPSMGTEAAMVFAGDETRRDAARETVQDVFARFEQGLSAWNPASGLSKINAAAGDGRGAPAAPEFLPVYRAAEALARESGGAFNPLVGAAMRLYGFNGAKEAAAPSPAALAAVSFNWRGFSVSPDGRIVLRDRGMKLDLGAIAKGAAVDSAYAALTAALPAFRGVIDLGGNLRAASGPLPGAPGWRTAIRNPFDKNSSIAEFVLRPGEAVATSGNYERFRTIGGKRVSHILDGRTGLPAAGIAGCTVIAGNAQTADGLSTALFVLGPEEGTKLLERIAPGTAAAWIPDAPGERRIAVNAAMAERLENIAPGWKTETTGENH